MSPETYQEHYPDEEGKQEEKEEWNAEDNDENSNHSPPSPPLPFPGTYMPPPDPLSTCSGHFPPPIDRLYIDMNGFIHGCSHNNNAEKTTTSSSTSDQRAEALLDSILTDSEIPPPTERTEQDVFADLCYYLDRIVKDVAQPRELLYLAIDGVAPRAKLNQQRARRYRSAKEGEIEQTVYDAHWLQQQEQEQQEQQNTGDDPYDKDPFATDNAEEDDRGQVRTAKSDWRFTGKFETQSMDSPTEKPLVFQRSSQSSNKDDEPKHTKNPSATTSTTDQERETESDEHHPFHSNEITPGTPFFDRCTQHLEHFIQRKISTDPAWKDLTVIFSGPNVPGEGEHKILHFIRCQQALEDYNPNLRHCIVGQDGDLIVLGLATHEPNLLLLRERVIFDPRLRQARQNRIDMARTNHEEEQFGPEDDTKDEEDKDQEGVSSSSVPATASSARWDLALYLHNAHFEFLHMNVLRDYLALEFGTSNVVPESPYDLEATIDDFVFLTFLVGNDFLPSLPAMDIGDDAFDLLFYSYRQLRQGWMQEYQQEVKRRQKQQQSSRKSTDKQQDLVLPPPPYLTHAGSIVSGDRLQAFFQHIGSYESNYHAFKDSTTDMEQIRRLEAQWGHSMTPEDDILESKERADRERYRALVAKGAANAVATAAAQTAVDVSTPLSRRLQSGGKNQTNDFVPVMSSSLSATNLTSVMEAATVQATSRRRDEDDTTGSKMEEEEDDEREQEGLLNRIGRVFRFSIQNPAGTKNTDSVEGNEEVSLEKNKKKKKKKDQNRQEKDKNKVVKMANNVTMSAMKDTIDDKDFKGRYYADKFGFSPFDKDKHLALRKAYIEGLVWTLKYYYHDEPASWEWFYPYHYGPMMSDLTNLEHLLKKEIRFAKGEPLLPFEQLLACMPASHAHILPQPYRSLMRDADSPLIEFYPQSFTVDMNGKRWPWEAVVLLPFIDSQKLRNAASQINQQGQLTKEEVDRNSVDQAVVFYSSENVDYQKKAIKRNDSVGELEPLNPLYPQFGGVENCTTVRVPFSKSHWRYKNTSARQGMHPPRFKPMLQPNVEIPLDGLPTLRDGTITGMKRRLVRVNVHGTGSRYQTALLNMRNELPESVMSKSMLLESMAEHLIGTCVYINYPFMTEAFVTAVSDARREIRGKSSTKMGEEQRLRVWTGQEAEDRKTRIKSIIKAYRKGGKLTGTGGLSIAGVTDDAALVEQNTDAPQSSQSSSSRRGSTTNLPSTSPSEILLSVRPLKRVHTIKSKIPGEASEIANFENKERGSTGSVMGKLYSKFEVDVPLFVTTWKPVREDRRLVNLPALLEKDPYRAAKPVNRGTTRSTISVMDQKQNRIGNLKESVGSAETAQYSNQTKAMARGFSTWTRPTASFSSSRALDWTRKGASTTSFHRAPRGATGVVCHPSMTSSCPRFERKPYHSISTTSHLRHVKRKGIHMLTFGLLVTAAWMVNGASAAATIFDLRQRQNNGLSENNVQMNQASSLPCSIGGSHLGAHPVPSQKIESFGPIDMRKPTPPLLFAHGTTTLAFLYHVSHHVMASPVLDTILWIR